MLVTGRPETADAAALQPRYETMAQADDEGLVGDIDYAMLQKNCGANPQNEKRYSPAVCLCAIARPITGDPNPKSISTSCVERQNLMMRMPMRRFTRLTNRFSKKVEMHAHSIAVHSMYYNFCKIRQPLRITAAMEAGVSDHVWSLGELVALVPYVKATPPLLTPTLGAQAIRCPR
jgi:hypothetical protein